jgi:hypothetical protein
MQLIDYSVPAPTAMNGAFQPASMQIGFWDLGEGELDGPSTLWINDILQMAFAPGGGGALMGNTLLGYVPSNSSSATENLGNTPTLSAFNFHTGADAPLTGNGVDGLWSYLGSLVTPLAFSRRSYYSIAWTPAITDGGTLSPLLDMRGMRCRMFYADGQTAFTGFSTPPPYGTQTGYGFTTNPIWHFVDLWLRRAIKPEYGIDPVLGPDALTAQESALFNWPSIVAAANYCDQAINITSQNPTGTPRFQGSYVFAAGSTLAAMLEQVLLSCRGYWYEYAGQIYVFIDQPRPSSCLITAEALAGGSIEIDNTLVKQNANRYQGQFLETGLPAVATIATISVDSTGTILTVNTVNPNPCAVGDLISMGGVQNSLFNLNVVVSAIPTTTVYGVVTPSPTQFTCTIDAGTIPASTASTGGSIGYIQSRFSQRNPEINHQQHQICEGQVLPPNVTGTRLKRIKVNYDFASATYDQAMRLLQYEVYRDLGVDYLNPNLLLQAFGNLNLLGSPYTPPWQITLNFWAEWVDKSQDTSAGQVNPSLWRALKAQMAGDVVTLDPTVFFEFAGDYEITGRTLNPFQEEVEDSTGGGFVQATSRSGAMNTGTDQNSGVLQLVLRTFNPSAAIFTDVSPVANASFATVPGQLPYAGTTSGGGTSGVTIVPFSFTATTPSAGYNPPSEPLGTVQWPNFVVDYDGSLTEFSAGETTQAQVYTGGNPNLYGGTGPWVLYLTPTQRGGDPQICAASLTSSLLSGSTLLGGSFTMPSTMTSLVPISITIEVS